MSYFLLCLSSVFGAVGQLFLKLGANSGGFTMFYSLNLWVGFFLYIMGTVLWIYALSKLDLSIVYPFTALTFVFVSLLSFFVLGETFSLMRLVGLLLVFAGLIILLRFS